MGSTKKFWLTSCLVSIAATQLLYWITFFFFHDGGALPSAADSMYALVYFQNPESVSFVHLTELPGGRAWHAMLSAAYSILILLLPFNLGWAVFGREEAARLHTALVLAGGALVYLGLHRLHYQALLYRYYMTYTPLFALSLTLAVLLFAQGRKSRAAAQAAGQA